MPGAVAPGAAVPDVVVLDASVALAWLVQRVKPEEAAVAEQVLRGLNAVKAIVPALWHVEITNGLVTAERRKAVTEAQGSDFLARLGRLPIRTDEVPLSQRRETLRALAREHSLTAYDAAYLELALREGAALASFDGALVAAMRRAGGVVVGG